MKKKTKVLVAGGLAVVILVCAIIQPWKTYRKEQIQVEKMMESSKEMQNPNCGFYRIYTVMLSEQQEDVQAVLQKSMQTDTQNTLALMEINLYNYRNGAISTHGMQQLQQLFEAMADSKKHWIVRFLYDWGERTEEFEPDSIKQILGHMEQAKPLLKQYADDIFAVQGLFTGIYGEMNGTQYGNTDSMKLLANQMLACTDETTYLSVRTPVQYRNITGVSDPLDQASALTRRLGLYNDGMLGSDSDLGTYGVLSKQIVGNYSAWNRREELSYQDQLCEHVPNGGEVVIDNSYNDMDNAIQSLKTMHVTYLNGEYDQAVMDKWAASVVHTHDCFDGMDGLSYIKRHLGYRFVLTDPKMDYDRKKELLHVKIALKNVGFAPVYKACDGLLVVKNEKGAVVWKKTLTEDLSGLPGGKQANNVLTVTKEIPLSSKKEESYFVYFALKDRAQQTMIEFANRQEQTADGYLLGTITFVK